MSSPAFAALKGCATGYFCNALLLCGLRGLCVERDLFTGFSAECSTNRGVLGCVIERARIDRRRIGAFPFNRSSERLVSLDRFGVSELVPNARGVCDPMLIQIAGHTQMRRRPVRRQRDE